MSFGVLVLVSTQAISEVSPRRSRKSTKPARKRSPLLRRLSQFSSVTVPPPRLLRSLDRGERAVDRAAGRARDVGRQLGITRLELVVAVEVVPRFGDGERDDARGGVGTHIDQRGQRRFVRHDALDRADSLVVALAGRRDRFQRVLAALALQRRDRVGHVRPQVAGDDHPVVIALLDQAMQIDRLVRAMERPEPEMQDDRLVHRHAACRISRSARPWLSK